MQEQYSDTEREGKEDGFMKKQIGALFAGMLLVSACPSAAAEDTELSFAWWGNQTRNERTQQILDMYSEENEGITFTPIFTDWGDYWMKLATAAAGHTLPDIVQMDYSYLKQYVSNDLLLDLTPYIESGVIDLSEADESIIDSARIGNGIYAICNGINVPALMYNEDVLEEAGIGIKNNMTTEEFIGICRQVYEKTGYRTNIAYRSDSYIEYFCRAYGETIYEEDRIGAGRESLEAFYGLYENGIAEGWLMDPGVFAEVPDGSVDRDPMVHGSDPDSMSWCMFAYSNQMSSVAEAAPSDMRIGMTTWPSPDPVRSNFLKPSQFFAVTADCENPDEAAKVLDYITNSVECNKVLLGERGIPVSSAVFEAIREDLSESNQEIIRFIHEVVTPNSSELDPAAPTQAAGAYRLNDKLVEEVCYGTVTAAQAAERMLTEGNAIMAGNVSRDALTDN